MIIEQLNKNIKTTIQALTSSVSNFCNNYSIKMEEFEIFLNSIGMSINAYGNIQYYVNSTVPTINKLMLEFTTNECKTYKPIITCNFGISKRTDSPYISFHSIKYAELDNITNKSHKGLLDKFTHMVNTHIHGATDWKPRELITKQTPECILNNWYDYAKTLSQILNFTDKTVDIRDYVKNAYDIYSNNNEINKCLNDI